MSMQTHNAIQRRKANTQKHDSELLLYIAEHPLINTTQLTNSFKRSYLKNALKRLKQSNKIVVIHIGKLGTMRALYILKVKI